jgi:hypothetical protein
MSASLTKSCMVLNRCCYKNTRTKEKESTLTDATDADEIEHLLMTHGLSTSAMTIFEEAFRHCRWKKVLINDGLAKINILDYSVYTTFEEIIPRIYEICEDVKGLGMLTIYDITAALCRYYNINIDKVYIIGNGPKRAIKLLNLHTKQHNITNKVKLNYVEIDDIKSAFDYNKLYLDEDIRNTVNGDVIETYICNWQKTQL